MEFESSVAELGVYKGYTAREMNALFKERKLYFFDTFTGFDSRDLEYENLNGRCGAKSDGFSDTSAGQVKNILPTFP